MVHSSLVVGGASRRASTSAYSRTRPYSNEQERNAVLTKLLSDPQESESPPKRMKITMSASSPIKRRSFGEEIDGNNLDAVNISMLSMESKDTLSTQATTSDTASDCATEASSVAMLRGWLDDFGKQSKTHYTKNSILGKTPEPATLEKPTRPRVTKTAASALAPTPLPPPAAQQLIKKRIIIPDTAVSKNHNRGCMTATQTPIRMKPAYDKEQVQATDQGYASVAKLSAWLADDPTTTKKVRQIRRGANVIAKSRKFDKGLANVIVQQNNIRTGSVAAKKQWLELASSGETTETDDDDAATSVSDRKQHWLDGRSMVGGGGSVSGHAFSFKDSASSNSVSNKKQWLGKAFKKADSTLAVPNRARTDMITAQDERNELSFRAKKMWRNRAPSSSNNKRMSTTGSVVVVVAAPIMATPVKKAPEERRRAQTQVKAPEPEREKPELGGPNTRRFCVQEEEDQQVQQQQQQQQPTTNFHSARASLITRSKANGNGVQVVSKVKNRKAKFERLQRESRRMSAPLGLLKASWDEADEEDGPSNSYIKKYVQDIVPKKSFEELP